MHIYKIYKIKKGWGAMAPLLPPGYATVPLWPG
jgi:hypothetical protein